jgi:2-hydroxy-3-keto-5-methylthiopentenyl-1-phosphate phosphatase
MADGETRRALLVTDFDGTLTRRDFFQLVVEAFAPEALEEYWDGYRAGRYTHFEALAGIFTSIRASEEEVLAVVRRAELEPELKPWLERLHAAGWDVVVTSAGCRWYVERLLGWAGVAMEVHANPGRFEQGRGLVMSLPVDSPYFDAGLGIDKSAVVRRAMEEGRTVAFAGDGFPDAAAAKLVPEALRFARADLATALTRDGLKFRPFERWAEVARALCE